MLIHKAVYLLFICEKNEIHYSMTASIVYLAHIIIHVVYYLSILVKGMCLCVDKEGEVAEEKERNKKKETKQ